MDADPDATPQPAMRPADDLLSRLEVIESQPLTARAVSYEAVHDELARRLEHQPGASAPSQSAAQ
ncbi:hypothetical protein GCM10009808_11760 [Microbacterium sediminicola]|uniref:Uncharacterized protein n=1 Tax=Microbacterium sediminicola TaxID=415210 RepID=A0ABN2HZI7_9MICO